MKKIAFLIAVALPLSVNAADGGKKAAEHGGKALGQTCEGSVAECAQEMNQKGKEHGGKALQSAPAKEHGGSAVKKKAQEHGGSPLSK